MRSTYWRISESSRVRRKNTVIVHWNLCTGVCFQAAINQCINYFRMFISKTL